MSPISHPSRAMRQNYAYSVPWNLGLIVLGAALIALGFKAIVLPHGFISGGVTGAGLLCYYLLGGLSPGLWFLALNVPIFLLGWLLVSRRFILYSLVGMLLVTLFIEIIPFTFPIQEKILAVLAAGTIMGAGTGIALRSLGSTGGVDILAIILYQKFNLSVGQVSFVFNLLVFGLGLVFLNADLVLYSLALVYIQSSVLEYFLGLFNQRRLALVISDQAQAIADRVLHELGRGATLFHGHGAYTGQRKTILLTVVNNLQVKRLEEIVFTLDPEAFTIFGNTLSVLGKGFSSRKQY